MIEVGQPISELDTPQLLIDLDIVDANLQRMQTAAEKCGVHLRVHFKSLKCAGLAKYLASRGVDKFLCAKLCEAEVLADSGLMDIFIANQIVGSKKLGRLAELARRAKVSVCVDDAENVSQLSQAAQCDSTSIAVLVEVDIGMSRCGVKPGEATVQLACRVADSPGLRFVGLQGYDGHLQMIPDPEERKTRCLQGIARLIETRRMIEYAGLPVQVVTGAGTGTWEFVADCEGVTEIQPGSFILMDCIYHQIRPEFACSLSILSQVISRRPNWYVLDAGSKAISQDFGKPAIKGRPDERVIKLSEEHAVVECDTSKIHLGDQREVLPAHCCATMNLHRTAIGVRKGKVEAIWPIEASGRYD